MGKGHAATAWPVTGELVAFGIEIALPCSMWTRTALYQSQRAPVPPQPPKLGDPDCEPLAMRIANEP